MKYYGKITDNKDLTTKEFVEGHHDSAKQDALTVNPETTTDTLNSLTINGTAYKIGGISYEEV